MSRAVDTEPTNDKDNSYVPPKFVFVHVSKTGGETLITLLGIPKDHRSASQRLNNVNDNDGVWKFAVVRNPWDRLVSWYFHLRRHMLPDGYIDKHTSALGKMAPCFVLSNRCKVKKMNPAEHRGAAERLTFREWIVTVLNQPDLYKDPLWGPCGTQYEALFDVTTGKQLVDDIYKYESGYSEVVLPAVLNRLGREDLIRMIQVTNNCGPPRPHYSHYYERDHSVIAEVARYFANDIVAFNYEFEEKSV